jgi:uncharacterized protein
MYWHLILTEKCNSNCRYCYEKSMEEFENGLQNKWDFELDVPCDSQVDVSKLKNFLDKDPDAVVIFYGGEPLLQIEKMKKIMDSVGEHVRFCMQTNGKLLNKLEEKYLKKFSKILVSIDGDKKRTDYNRGEGTYDLILENIKEIKSKGFEGEVVARMTISQEHSDLYEQVRHLVDLIDLRLFDSIHFQLDVGFYKNDFDSVKFKKFVKEYNSSLTKLVDYWLALMRSGRVVKIYPFLGIFESLYYNKKTKLRCGSGYINYTITTDGKITACPIMNNVKNFYCGSIDSELNELKKFDVISPCTECEYLDLCGGRCLYSNHAKLWPVEGEKMICMTIKHLIEEVRRVMPEIKNLIDDEMISEEDFFYEKYFGPEIIP